MASNVSVIIPSYNRANLLTGAIESVLKQTVPVLEIIVVDDGSVDNTQEVCARYPNVRYVYQRNQGVSAARNTGIRLSQGDCLIFLDSDDRLLPKAVQIGLHYLESRPEVGYVFGHCTFIDNHGFPVEIPPTTYPETAGYETILAGEHILAPAGRMVRRSAIEKAGMFLTDLGHGEDTEFWLRLAQHCPIYYHQQMVFEYCLPINSIPGLAAKISIHSAEMLVGLMYVLALQKDYVQNSGNPAYQLGYQQGKKFWIGFYGPELFRQMVDYAKVGKVPDALKTLGVMLWYYPQGVGVVTEYFQRFIQRMTRQVARSPLGGEIAID